MNADNTYNGWTNRETWLVNLHFVNNDYFDEMINQHCEEDIFIDLEQPTDELKKVFEEHYDMLVDFVVVLTKEEVESHIDEQNLSVFVQDFIDTSTINYTEIAKHIVDEYILSKTF
jgi:hypothetical protein